MSSKLKIYSYSVCSTCRKALNWLEKNNIEYQLIDIVKNPPSEDTISFAIDAFGDKKYLFNTRGKSYRNLGAEAVKKMTKKEAIHSLCNDGKLIKRPFLIKSSGEILLGFDEVNWSQNLLV